MTVREMLNRERTGDAMFGVTRSSSALATAVREGAKTPDDLVSSFNATHEVGVAVEYTNHDGETCHSWTRTPAFLYGQFTPAAFVFVDGDTRSIPLERVRKLDVAAFIASWRMAGGVR